MKQDILYRRFLRNLILAAVLFTLFVIVPAVVLAIVTVLTDNIFFGIIAAAFIVWLIDRILIKAGPEVGAKA